MARKTRIEMPGFHYIYNSSLNEKEILIKEPDKDKFLEILEEVSYQYNIKIHSFCITHTSYHILLENSLSNLSLVMRQINSLYSMYFNKKYNCSGGLWQDRFKSWYVSNFKYLLNIYKYIESTPVFKKLASNIGEYTYSSSFIILNNKILNCLKESFILKRFTKKELYEYFKTPITQEELTIIKEFKKEKVLIKKEEYTKVKVTSLYYVFKDVTSKKQRNHKIYYAFKKGYKQSEISRYLNLSDSSISKIIKEQKFMT